MVSTMFDSLKLYPGGNDGSGWTYFTAAVPEGVPLELIDLLADKTVGLKVISTYLKNDLRGRNDCIASAYHDTGPLGDLRRATAEKGFSPMAQNYKPYALTKNGLDIGFGQAQLAAEACGTIRGTVPWSMALPLFNAMGRHLVAGLP